ncbi:MAG: DUF1003 domain-containing protein [Ornithinimicrobium sp.]
MAELRRSSRRPRLRADKARSSERLDQPKTKERGRLWRPNMDPDTFGRFAEGFARFMGTARFLAYMSLFVAIWLLWNSLAPTPVRFDPYAFIFLTLMLSLQASYAAPLILLAQNRQADRDKVTVEQDRSRDERALAETEFLTREVASLRIAMRDTATRDFVRSELRSLLDDMEERGLRVRADPPESESSSETTA